MLPEKGENPYSPERVEEAFSGVRLSARFAGPFASSFVLLGPGVVGRLRFLGLGQRRLPSLNHLQHHPAEGQQVRQQQWVDKRPAPTATRTISTTNKAGTPEEMRCRRRMTLGLSSGSTRR
jgi:hypothetical protein